MHFTDTQIMAWLAGFMWPFLRISVFIATMPIFGSKVVPVKIRIAMAVILTLSVTSLIPPVPKIDLFSATSLLISVNQVLIGVTMAFIFHLVFSLFVMGGQIIAMQMGLGFASMIDPQNGVQVPVISQFFVLMVTLLFFTLDGHLAMITLILDSFQTLPINAEFVLQENWWNIVLWANEMFANAVRLALPAVVIILLVNMAFGIVTRAAPQFNIFAVGFPFMLLVGFVAIYFSLGNISPIFIEAIESATQIVKFM